jgi:hypothetical protein
LWSKSARRSGSQDAAEGRTFHVARRAARSGVPQAVAHLDTGSAVWREHMPDFIEAQRRCGKPERRATSVISTFCS